MARIELKYTADGYEVHIDGRPRFIGNNKKWTAAERTEAGEKAYMNALSNIIKTGAINSIRSAYNFVMKRPYVDSDGVKWVYGFDSVGRLEAARQWAINSNMTTVKYFDSERNTRILSLEEAKTLLLGMGSKLQQNLASKNKLINAINAATNEDEIATVLNSKYEEFGVSKMDIDSI